MPRRSGGGGASARPPHEGRSGIHRQPFWQAFLILGLAYLLFEFGIPYLLPALGVRSAPVPRSVLLQYMLTVLVGVLLYVSADEDRWRRFQEPIHRTLTDPGRGRLRAVLLVALPALVGFLVYQSVKPSFGAPAGLRSIHPAPPGQITFREKTLRLQGLENPLRRTGSSDAHYATGRRLYAQNCVPCHGDRLDGHGHFAHGLNPVPLAFTGTETIDQLQESYVFWRIAKGGPGLPNEGAPWNSAMPAWEEVLTEEEIWSVILFLYEQTGATPRTWEASGAAGEEE